MLVEALKVADKPNPLMSYPYEIVMSARIDPL